MKEKNKYHELDALADAYLEGRLSEEDALRLSHLIEESGEARERYWQLASVHGLVEQSMQNASLKAATGQGFAAPVKTDGLFRWPKVASVAAGVVIGVFSASLVWAFKTPQAKPQLERREIVLESFEDPGMKMSGRFPTVANQWQGRILSVPREVGMPAVAGTRVGKFNKGPEPKFTYARYLIDMEEHAGPAEGRVRSVEVKASFFSANAEESAVFQIRLAAFSEEPEEVRPIWNDQETLFNTVLQHVGRNHTTQPGEQSGWRELRATIEVPPGTRSIVVSLGAGNADPDNDNSEHYVDAVQVHLVDGTGPLG